MKREKLTKSFIESLQGQIKIMDHEIPTLELWSREKSKVFYFRKCHNFKQYRRALGRYPEYTREMAVKQCHIYTSNLTQFGSLDPAEDGKKTDKITLKEAWEHYCKYKKASQNTIARWNKFFIPFANRAIAEIAKSEFKSIHAEITRTSPTTANRAIAEIKAVINLAIKDEIYDGNNPASKITMNKETPRMKYLEPIKAPEVIQVLEEMRKFKRTRGGAEAMLIMLYQGQRKGNVLAMEWNEINSENIWTIPREKAKSNKDIICPLVSETIEIINGRKNNGSKYVFPTKNLSTHIMDCKKLWKTLCQRCGVKNMHIHDLRHTSATYQLREGADIATVSDNMGHADISITKRVYAHVLTDTQRNALQNAAKALKGSANDSLEK